MKAKKKSRSNRAASDKLLALYEAVARHAKELLKTMQAEEPPDAHYWVEGQWNAEPAYHLRLAIKAVEANARHATKD